MAININLNRTGLVNKRTSGATITKEHITFESIGGQSRAILKESIWFDSTTNNGAGAFTPVLVYHGDIQLIEGTDFTVQNEASTITLLSTPEDNRYYASYTGGGSIVWAQDVNELQVAVQTIATDALDKTGDTMSGTLNMNNNIIAYASTYNGVRIETHNHSDGQGGLIPSTGIEDGAITTSKIASEAVETSKIKSLAVTNDKIESVDVGKVNGLGSLLNQSANRYLTNLYNGLENVVCTENPKTTDTATLQQPVVISKTYRDSSTGTYYNLYSNGWIEMGGITYVGTDSTATVTFPNNLILKDNNYSVQLTLRSDTTTTNNTAAGSIWYTAKSVSGFTIINDLWGGDVSWEAKGVATGTSSRTLYQNDEIMYNIDNNKVNTLYTYTTTGTEQLYMELGGTPALMSGFDAEYEGIDGGGIIKCLHTFPANTKISVKAICGSISLIVNANVGGGNFNYYGPVAVGIYLGDGDTNPVLIAASGALAVNPRSAHDIFHGGCGYVGGAAGNPQGLAGVDLYNGLNYDGTTGQSTDVVPSSIASGTGVIRNPSGTTLQYAYGGIGYVASGYTNSYTGTTRNRGNAYAIIKLIS